MLDSQTLADAPSVQAASTNNWDTVFSVDFEAVNDGIRANGGFPRHFHHEQSSGPDLATIDGDFTAWELTGGSGHLLEMTLPISTFTYTMTGDPDETRNDAWVTIQLSLYQVVGKEGSGIGGGTPVSFTSCPPSDLLANADDFSVVVTDFGWDGSDTEPMLAQNCRILMADYFRLQSSLEAFDHTFVTVNLNARLATETTDFSWLVPTDTSYGVIADGGQGGGSFAVLCMVNNNTPPANHNVSTEISGGRRAGFLINKPIFLDHMVKPGIARMFGREADDTAFVEENFITDANRITNSNKLTIADFSVNGSDNVTAVVPKRTFSITMNDTSLSLDYQGLHHPYYKLIKFMYEAHHYLRMDASAGFDPDTRHFLLLPKQDAAGDPVISYRAALEKSDFGKGVDVALLIADILGVVSAVFNGVAAVRGTTVAAEQGANTGIFARSIAKIMTTFRNLGDWMKAHPAFIWAGVVTGILGITATVAKDLFENARENDPTLIKPDMQEFALNVLAPIQWPTGAGLTVEDVAFNGGFHITGTPDFTAE